MQKLAQLSYNRKVGKLIKEMLRQIAPLSCEFEYNEIDTIFENMSQERRQLVTPIKTSSSQKQAKWILSR